MVSAYRGLLAFSAPEIHVPDRAEKQTFEFNVRVRAEFKKTVHARMGA